MIRTKSVTFTFFLLLAITCSVRAQSELTLDEAIDLAIRNNKELETYRLKSEQSRKLKGEAFDLGSTDFYYSYDENNVAENDLPLKVLGFEQNFDFPTVYLYRLKAAKTQAETDAILYELNLNDLTKRVSQAYYKVLILKAKLPHLKMLDSLYDSYITAVANRYTAGESSYLESLTSRAHGLQAKTNYIQLNEDLKNELQKLHAIIQSDTLFQIPNIFPNPLEIRHPDLEKHFGVTLYEEMQKLNQNKLNIERNMLLPSITLGYFQGTNKGENAKIYPGFEIGVSVPVFFGAQNARIQAARIEKEISAANALNYSALLKSHKEEIMSEIRKYSELLKQFESLGKETVDEIIKYSNEAYEHGEIDFPTYINSVEHAINIETGYLDNLNSYNQAVLELNYLNLKE